MSIAHNSLKRVKAGLGCICFGVIVSLLILLIYAIFGFIGKQPSSLATVCGIILVVSQVFEIVGVVICLFSGNKHFTATLIIYLIVVITAIVLVIVSFFSGNTRVLNAIFYILCAVAHVSFVLALKDVSKGKSTFNVVLAITCAVLYIVAFILAIVGQQSIGRLLASIENVLFLIVILAAYTALK